MYSVRMRAEKDGKHISGAERITGDHEIFSAAQSLIDRALSHEKGKPDFINISLEELKIPIKNITSLPLILTHVRNAAEGRALAGKLLLSLGIPLFCIEKAITLLGNGAAGGESMRGAMIMNMSGERLEPDKYRGIRASRMDITEEASAELARSIKDAGLSSYYAYISEALVLATKVASVNGNIAELCWSDDPSYTAGYVASKIGYVRIPHLKPEGDSRGGRVFFVDGIDLDSYIHEMEKAPVLVNKFGGIKELTVKI
ncbi:MAG: 6-carboxyhexanoate--CoA ligase [Candidatus Methanoperedens sp.]|nr:6-carboxyhexanoate--CoA ligase [Candidatus Methanoperedens sp.]MCZ7395747.1 6-carboxyhexanoate--CoA ligase [Candidatus Methanoperedens sp.]